VYVCVYSHFVIAATRGEGLSACMRACLCMCKRVLLCVCFVVYEGLRKAAPTLDIPLFECEASCKIKISQDSASKSF
jgi:hypothetical protein